MRKLMIVLCGMMLALSLAGCGKEEEPEPLDLYGVWEDESGNLLEFLPEESAYILKTSNGRTGRGEYTPGKYLRFTRFLYDFEMLDDGSIVLHRNGMPAEWEENLDGFVFSPSDVTGIEENDISILNCTWVNDEGTIITFNTETNEYNFDSEMTTATGTMNDEYDGRGIFIFSDGHIFIDFHDDGSISFETDKPDLSGYFYPEE